LRKVKQDFKHFFSRNIWRL